MQQLSLEFRGGSPRGGGGGLGACSPGKFFQFKPSEMARNSLKTNMVW